MTDPDSIDDTSRDYERFEAEMVAHDQDTEGVATADIDESAARHLVGDLIECGVVTPVAEERALVHDPSSTAFESITQLAVFHRGWTAAQDVDETE